MMLAARHWSRVAPTDRNPKQHDLICCERYGSTIAIFDSDVKTLSSLVNASQPVKVIAESIFFHYIPSDTQSERFLQWKWHKPMLHAGADKPRPSMLGVHGFKGAGFRPAPNLHDPQGHNKG
jgi:hypothetical protein